MIWAWRMILMLWDISNHISLGVRLEPQDGHRTWSMVIVTNKNPEDGSKNLLVYEAINGGGIMEAEIELRPHHNTIISNRTLVLQTKIVSNHPFHSLSFSLASWTVFHVPPTMTWSSISAFSYPSILDSFIKNGRLLQRNTCVEESKCGQHWTTTHGLTHRNRSMLLRFRVPQHRVESYIWSIYPTISCDAVLNPPRLNPPCLNPSYLRLRFLRTIRCGVCSVFCFFVGSLTSTLAWPDWSTKRTPPEFSLVIARSWSNAKMRVSKSLR